MSLIKPFAGLRPKPEFATDVVAPPYDVLNTEEARQRAAGRGRRGAHRAGTTGPDHRFE